MRLFFQDLNAINFIKPDGNTTEFTVSGGLFDLETE